MCNGNEELILLLCSTEEPLIYMIMRRGRKTSRQDFAFECVFSHELTYVAFRKNVNYYKIKDWIWMLRKPD